MPARPSLPSPAVFQHGSGSTEGEAQEFVQSRVALFLRTVTALFGVMYAAGLVLFGIVTPEAFRVVHEHPSKIVHLSLVAVLAAGWLWLRRKPRSLGAIWALDAGGVLAVSLGVGLMVGLAPGGYHLEVGALFMVILTLVLRSAIVPSTPLRTALLGFCASPGIGVGAYRQAVDSGLDGFLTPPIVAAMLALWCAASTALATMVSKVVYGLMAQIREARRLGQYTLGLKLGEGGMGEVYRAEHAMLRRATAVKLLLPDRIGGESLARFEREVRLTSQLSHPNTIAIYDYGRTPKGVFYYAMEYLEGSSLDKLVADEGPQPAGRVVHILQQIAGSLAEAHEAGLIHRDIKPSNVLLCTRGGIREFVKVIDFGLVKRVDGGEDVALTQTNTLTGTPLFMAPECARDPEHVTSSVDVYALGAVGYFLITASPPFAGRSVVEVVGHHLLTAPTPPSERLGADVPPKLEALLLRCLEKDPESRPDDTELARLLRECRSESPWHAADWSAR